MILNDLAKYGISKNIFHKSLLILNCRSISKLTLNWGHELLQALGEFFSQTQKKSILKMQKLCNGTKDIWDLLKLDRVWNWCYLNKSKNFHLVLKIGLHIYPDVTSIRNSQNIVGRFKTLNVAHVWIYHCTCSVTRLESEREKNPRNAIWRAAF